MAENIKMVDSLSGSKPIMSAFMLNIEWRLRLNIRTHPIIVNINVIAATEAMPDEIIRFADNLSLLAKAITK